MAETRFQRNQRLLVENSTYGKSLPPVGAEKVLSQVIAYCWEVTADHPRLLGKAYTGGGERVKLGERGPWFSREHVGPLPAFTVGLDEVPAVRPWGLRQVWKLRNGQEVYVTWK